MFKLMKFASSYMLTFNLIDIVCHESNLQQNVSSSIYLTCYQLTIPVDSSGLRVEISSMCREPSPNQVTWHSASMHQKSGIVFHTTSGMPRPYAPSKANLKHSCLALHFPKGPHEYEPVCIYCVSTVVLLCTLIVYVCIYFCA